MLKHLIKSIIFIIFLSYNSTIFAEIRLDFINCSSIENNSERLSCYDKIASDHQSDGSVISNKVNSKHSSFKKAASNKSVSKPTKQVSKSKLLIENSQAPSDKQELEPVHSKVIGSFKGLTKGRKLKLENGQVWKVVSSGVSYKKVINPRITIKLGLFGSFSAKFEGLSGLAKVKRIK